jgi:hypothetical protein
MDQSRADTPRPRHRKAANVVGSCANVFTSSNFKSSPGELDIASNQSSWGVFSN